MTSLKDLQSPRDTIPRQGRDLPYAKLVVDSDDDAACLAEIRFCQDQIHSPKETIAQLESKLRLLEASTGMERVDLMVTRLESLTTLWELRDAPCTGEPPNEEEKRGMLEMVQRLLSIKQPVESTLQRDARISMMAMCESIIASVDEWPDEEAISSPVPSPPLLEECD